jgi:hypothetical protein
MSNELLEALEQHPPNSELESWGPGLVAVAVFVFVQLAAERVFCSDLDQNPHADAQEEYRVRRILIFASALLLAGFSYFFADLFIKELIEGATH